MARKTRNKRTRKTRNKRTRKTRNKMTRKTRNKRTRKTRRVIKSKKNKRTRKTPKPFNKRTSKNKIMKGGFGEPNDNDWALWARAIDNANLDSLQEVYPGTITHEMKSRGNNTTFQKVYKLMVGHNTESKKEEMFNKYIHMMNFIVYNGLTKEDAGTWGRYIKTDTYKMLIQKYNDNVNESKSKGIQITYYQPYINHNVITKEALGQDYTLARYSEAYIPGVNYNYPGREDWNYKGDKKNVILFYGIGNHYYFLTNFWAENPFKDEEGLEWKTSEHYFQAQKFKHTHNTDNDLYKKIRNLYTPRETFDFARQNDNSIIPNWHDDNNKNQVMFCTLWYKFQVPEMKKKLLDTGDAELIENTNIDSYWGIYDNTNNPYKNNPGKNRLGVLLMKLRKYLREYT